MIHYIHVKGRQHGATADTAYHQIQLLEETMKRAFSESVQCHGIYYHQVRRRPHPAFLRKELVYLCAGSKGINQLNEVWYNTWVFLINLKIEGDMNENFIQALLQLHMKVEMIECTGRGPNETTKRMRHLRDRIPWSADGIAEMRDTEHCRYFGKKFGVGRDI
jgi:hypothetical protein